ncbi:alpha-1,3-mannosyl-glycoprotein 2-beta-N-acetylglucosaminyltransferase [Vanessa cardui]|uniref:alpha-1,3-mannosyl-glycoprotein 2-beta-N-acetylglucosaminyltransferase n=1 Tax=Vanessa cardui TaxID=171605 RepID=UPI001F129358|nr:alpha-1,3-mannosyl-glycoprotein 2-beta-N-acetylglucosaminyltransferase [Vanessa cardui]
MRVNLRKFIIFFGCFSLIWVVVSYSSSYSPVYKPRSSVSEIEMEIDRLQQKVQNQLSDSYSLLQKVRLHLKKTEERNDESAKDSQPAWNEVDTNQNYKNPVLPILVIACDRVTVKRCLDNLVKFRPNKETFPIIVSQDCGHNETYHVIKSYTDSDPSITVVRQPNLSEIPLPRAKVKFKGYYKIARHYRFALNHVFVGLEHEAVIIVEDDLDISPDFFEYFLGTYPLLFKDPSIWCSYKNDWVAKFQIRFDCNAKRYFLPSISRFFDDWLRDPENTDGRACIRPEISRTYSFGKIGVSKGLFFDMHLRYMQLNMEFVEFTKLNLTYLIKDTYDENLTSFVYNLPEVSAEDVMSSTGTEPAVRVSYSTAKTYQRAAKKLGLMDDFRSGIPRAAYRGIVTCFIRNRRVYLAPSYEWTKYDPTWG